MGKVYKYKNEYTVDCGPLGRAEILAHSHSEAKYLAFKIFRDAYGARVFADCNDGLTLKKCQVTLLWFASIVKSVKMTHKSVLNQ